MKILSRQSLELIILLTVNHLKVKYKRTMLGFAWSLLNPIMQVLVIAIVFSTLLHQNFELFLIKLFPALLAWIFFANCINSGANSIISNENLIRKSPINIAIFPIVSVAVNFIEFILSLTFLIITYFFVTDDISVYILILPILIIFYLLTVVGLVLITSVLTTKYRDFGYLVGIILQLMFYMTPVIYTKDYIYGRLTLLDFILDYNPIVYFIEWFRNIVSLGNIMDFRSLIVGLIISFVTICLGYVYFIKNEKELVHRL
ncbi:ABC transporter permease [Vibrio nitrifigilis]|uniref:Transport permease protein n=1 Tax=Vibrio nitrifigilis TaxID=2789781 RepID=A0ABS0GFG3_9VIBR|nr:ABC transporter permease [Vibrio nitrifigilis]MBF9001155.1 ABC transporter permease [Vibrio nitrifigilis]